MNAALILVLLLAPPVKTPTKAPTPVNLTGDLTGTPEPSFTGTVHFFHCRLLSSRANFAGYLSEEKTFLCGGTKVILAGQWGAERQDGYEYHLSLGEILGRDWCGLGDPDWGRWQRHGTRMRLVGFSPAVITDVPRLKDEP